MNEPMELTPYHSGHGATPTESVYEAVDRSVSEFGAACSFRVSSDATDSLGCTAATITNGR